MPILVTDSQLKSTPQVQEAIFSPEELRDHDWMLKGYADAGTGKCMSLNTTEDNILLLLQDIRHHLQLTHVTVRAINNVLQCPNTKDIPNILQNIFKFVFAIYDDGFSAPVASPPVAPPSPASPAAARSPAMPDTPPDPRWAEKVEHFRPIAYSSPDSAYKAAVTDTSVLLWDAFSLTYEDDRVSGHTFQVHDFANRLREHFKGLRAEFLSKLPVTPSP